jgi:NAD(P) transhydrogenase subunit alpha
MPAHASMLYSKNLCNFLLNLYKGDSGEMDLKDELNKEALITHQGKILHRGTLKTMGEKAR